MIELFIININQVDKKNLYKCDKYKSNLLQRNGFSLLSIDGDDYYFTMTKELYKFLNPEGGDNHE